MRLVHCIAALHLDDGGPSRSVSQLAGALAARGADIHLVAGRDPEKAIVPLDARVVVHPVDAGHTTVWRRLRSRGFHDSVSGALGLGPTVVHTHGVWLRQSHDAIAAARSLCLPVVISPRGMLEPWALAYHAWKKRLAWWLYQRRDLQHVTAFHATADMEAESIRRLGFRQPIIVLPNGVALPAPGAHGSGVAASATREALFLSRIHPKKGIDMLIDAWGRLRPAGWRLTIAGNDEDGHAAVVERRIREAGLGESVRFVGPAYGADKERLFRGAHLFVLPSHSENFGIVVAEALAYGMPVLTTTGTPWAELVSRRCGWHVDPSPDAIADALWQAVTLPAAELAAMGAAGRELVAERYQWDAIAREFGNAYAALCTRDLDALAALPFVRTD